MQKGSHFTAESLAKMRAAHRTPEARKRASLAQTPESRRSNSMAHIGVVFSKEHCENISKSRRGIQFTEDHRKHMSEARQGKKQSLESIEKRRAFMKTPAGQELIAKTILSPGAIEKRGETYKDPLYRRAISDRVRGENHPSWKNGISFEPYCPRFNKDLKRRIRRFFDDKCIICGKSNVENGGELCCHHVEYNKAACCDGKPVQFAVLCRSCHTKTNYDRPRWEAMLHTIIREVYNNRSYYTRAEFGVI